MRRRIGALLDAGTMPTMRGNNLRLGDVVLQRTDGRDAPAMAEVERQMRARNIPLEGAFNSFGLQLLCAAAGAFMRPTWRGNSA